MRDIGRDEPRDHDDYFWFTGNARFSRDMHILHGYLQGLAADSKVGDVELKNLTKWLSEHREFADRHPFNEVIDRIQRIIVHGVVDEKERADLLWLSNKFSTDNRYYDDVTSDMQRLQGMLGGILADGRITEQEIRTLETWVAERSYLKGCWPYDELESIIAHVMRDGRIDAQEHEALLQLFGEFVSAGQRKSVGVIERGEAVSGVCSMSPIIQFENRCFCFTGSSQRGTRNYVASVVLQLDGYFHKNLRNDTDFLVVGADGNPCWAYACYGRKVEEAVERRRNGQRLVIVHEYDFWEAADSVPNGPKHARPPAQRPRHHRDLQPRQRRRHDGGGGGSRELGVQLPLAGKTLVVTGTLEKYTRDEIEAVIEQHGGRATSSVSKSTDYVVAGEKAGSKLDKAKKLGIPVLTEAQFDDLVAD